MPSRFASEQLASLRHDPQRFVEQAGDQEDHALGLVAGEDVNVPNRSPARLLVTASTRQAVETLARRIRGIGPRAQFPFVMTCAGELPIGAQALRDDCARSLEDAAAGGSVLVSTVEEMPSAAQDALTEHHPPRGRRRRA